MDVLDAIRKRRSIRKYLPVAVEWDKVVNVLEAGRHAPSAGNLQDWKFVVVTDVDKKRDIATACLNQVWMETAPIHIVICSNPEKPIQQYGDKGEEYSKEDAACVAMNMMLAATREGLGSCWVGAFEETMLIEAVAIPTRATPRIILTLGYPDEIVPTPPRIPLESLVYLQSYGNRIKNINMVMWDWSLMMEDFVKKSGGKIKAHIEKVKEKIAKDMEKREEEKEEKKFGKAKKK